MSKDVPIPIDAPTPLVPTSKPILLNLQNAMPVITQSRSRELIYDILEDNPHFVKNPYGPQWLGFARSIYRWN